MSIQEQWETSEQVARLSLKSAINGPDLFEDMWTIKGGFYFIFSSFLVLYAAGLPAEIWIGGSLFLVLFTVISLLVNYRHFPERCKKVALFRSIQETHSIVKSRQSEFRIENHQFPGEIILANDTPVLEELGLMVAGRDWERFSRRFEYFEEKYEIRFLERIQELVPYLIDSILAGHRKLESPKSQIMATQTRTIAKVIMEFAEPEDYDSNKDGDDRLYVNLSSPLRTLIKNLELCISSFGGFLNLLNNLMISKRYEDEILEVLKEYPLYGNINNETFVHSVLDLSSQDVNVGEVLVSILPRIDDSEMIEYVLESLYRV